MPKGILKCIHIGVKYSNEEKLESVNPNINFHIFHFDDHRISE